MSYQPNTAVQPVTPAAPVKVPGKGGIWLGVLLIVVGIGGAIATFIAQQAAYEGTVENLERALPGFRTELVFEETGTFTLYYEHAGEFTTRLDGSEQEITLAGPETPPEFDVRLLDQNGDEVRLRQDVPDVSYDASGFKGIAYRQVSIDDVGRFTLEIVPDADSSAFALAVGKGTVSKPSAVLPAVIGLIGLGLGLLVILIAASRRKRSMQSAATSAAPALPPGYAVPTAPPEFAVPAPAPSDWSAPSTSGGPSVAEPDVAPALAPPVPAPEGRALPPPPLPREEVESPRTAPSSPWGPPGS
jgi:hypothetical protein